MRGEREGEGHLEVRRGWERAEPAASRLSAWKLITQTSNPLICKVNVHKPARGGERMALSTLLC